MQQTGVVKQTHGLNKVSEKLRTKRYRRYKYKMRGFGSRNLKEFKDL